MTFSPSKGGAFCKYCVLFSPDIVGGCRLSQLVNEPFKKWHKAIQAFKDHEQKTYHKKSVEIALSLRAIADNKKQSVDLMVQGGANKQRLENRRRILPIIETVIFCGKQGISLRGHRDSGPLDHNVEEQSAAPNEGNFRALLQLRIRAGDQNLKNHLENCGENASYISPNMQNEIISACNEYIRGIIVQRVNAAKCFSVLADETTDVSSVEQMSLCVRYLHQSSDGKVCLREDFLQFIPVADTRGKTLAHAITHNLSEYGLNLNYLRGQGYDGAASMSGHLNGVQSHIAEQFPLAPYVHCAAHSLNLAISSACTEQHVSNCMGTINSVYTFLRTPKRQAALIKSIDEKVPASGRHRLKQASPTRWIERHDSVLVFLELFPAIADTLEGIALWSDRNVASNSNQLLCAITQSTFVVTLFVIANVFSKSLPLSRFLQSEAIDLLGALEFARDTEDAFAVLREDAETAFHAIFKEASAVCQDMDIEIVIPRISQRQSHRVNVPVSSPEDYFRIAVFIPFVDHFRRQLSERLICHKDLLGSFMCLFPNVAPQIPWTTHCAMLKSLVEKYTADVQCDYITAEGELQMWHRRVQNMDIKPRTAVDSLSVCNQEIFPCIFSLLKVLATLPVSTCSNER